MSFNISATRAFGERPQVDPIKMIATFSHVQICAHRLDCGSRCKMQRDA
jgi:hypothetical protein